MGLSGGSQKQTYTPNPAQTQAASTLASVYNQNAGNTQNIANSLGSLIPSVSANIPATTSAVSDAANYYGDELSGKYLDSSSNPYLAAMLSQNDNAITDQVNSQFGAAGRTGSGGQAYALARGIGDVNNSLLESNYNSERANQNTAAAGAGTLSTGQLASLTGLATTASGLPLSAAQQYASGIGSLGLGGTTTTTSSPSLLSGLGSLVGLGTDIAGLGGSLGLWNLKGGG